MQNYSLPTREQCFELIRLYRVPQHIVNHSMAVAQLAVFLAEKLRAKGISINIDVVDRACLLHDIARACDFKKSDLARFNVTPTDQDEQMWQQLKERYPDLCHEDIAYELLREKYPEVALVIKRHRYMAIADKDDRPATWEEKLVYYADKRVMHDRVVPLKERLDDGHKRNVHLHGTKGRSDVNTAEVDPLIFELEEEIFGKLELNPLEVTDEFIDSC